MRILTAAEMGACDRRSVELGMSVVALMERAGEAVAKFVLRQYPWAERVLVLCGKGNNGGDGLVAARRLSMAGRRVRVVLLGREEDLKGEVLTAFYRMRAEASGVVVDAVADDAALMGLRNVLDDAEVIVDAVVGTGFRPPLRGVAVALHDVLVGLRAQVVAVDLPSGWNADTMEQTAEGAFRADAVVTFTAPKLAHVFAELTAGPVVVAQIGSPVGAVESELQLTWTGVAKAIAERPRDMNSNKGKFGHVLVIGGGRGKAGAPAMASLAALRTGAGLVTAAVPESIVNTVARITPELMLASLAEDNAGGAAMENLRSVEFDRLLKKMTVVAMGPGLGTEGDAPAFAREMVAKSRVPTVIDADALNAFEGRTRGLNGEGRVLVLTPHPGEMARLLGLTVKEVEADRVGLARKFATQHKVTLVLKGWRTLVAHPDGRVAVNTSGNPAMAKGGSGDILTGVVAAMLAQFPEQVAEAVEAAVFLHGLAADFAACAMDEHTVLATDTLAHLSDAFRYRVRDEDGMTWLAGVRA